MKLAGATHIEIQFGQDIFITWPALFDEPGWSVWTREGHAQGATRLLDKPTMEEAADYARRYAK